MLGKKTYITLLPKKSNQLQVSDFRPINLCNTIYKIAVKILANRLKPLLLAIMLPEQGAFIHSQNITKNILLDQAIMHTLEKAALSRGLALTKLDMEKTFD